MSKHAIIAISIMVTVFRKLRGVDMNKIVSDFVEYVETLEKIIEADKQLVEKNNRVIDRLEDLVHELDKEKNRLLVENVLLKKMLKEGESE